MEKSADKDGECAIWVQRAGMNAGTIEMDKDECVWLERGQIAQIRRMNGRDRGAEGV